MQKQKESGGRKNAIKKEKKKEEQIKVVPLLLKVLNEDLTVP